MRTWRVLTCSDSSMLERWSSSAWTLRSCSCFASFLVSAAESRPRRCSASSSASKSCTCNDRVKHSHRFTNSQLFHLTFLHLLSLFLSTFQILFLYSFLPYFLSSLTSFIMHSLSALPYLFHFILPSFLLHSFCHTSIPSFLTFVIPFLSSVTNTPANPSLQTTRYIRESTQPH